MDSHPDATIVIDGNRYALYRKTGRTNPYMVDISTGEIPRGDQRPLLKKYLLEHGVDIEPWEKRNTHWCIAQAIKLVESG